MDTPHIALFPHEHFLDIRPYQYGWEECEPLHSFGPFVRNHYLFHYIISGKGMLYSHAANGNIHEYRLDAGQGFLICPGQINLYTADEKDPWKYVWIEFDGMRAEECLLQAGLEQSQPIYRPRSIEEGKLLQETICSIFLKTRKDLPSTWLESYTCFWTNSLSSPPAGRIQKKKENKIFISMKR